MVDLDADPADNVKALAKAKGVEVELINVCVLDRPRHAEIIAKVREVGARVTLITDGDIAGVIHCTDPATGIDMYMGTGGAPEGVMTAPFPELNPVRELSLESHLLAGPDHRLTTV